MGIDIIEKEGKDIFVYKLPEFIKENKNFIGNNLNDFEILRVLEDGENSKVIKVKSKKDNGIYAMKQIELRLIEKYNLQKEIDLFREANHPNIIKCYSIFDEGNYKYIIMEFMNNGDLESYKELNTTFGINIAEQKIIEFAYNCLSALEYIHSKGRNRQLKLKNIFIDDNFNLKIGMLNITSLIAFEPNPNQERLDIEIFGNVLDNLLSYYTKNNEEKKLSAEMNSFILYLKNGKINSTKDVKALIKEMYIKNCVKNTSIESVLYCLNNFSNLIPYIYINKIKNLLSEENINKNKILAKQFVNVICSLNKRNDDKKTFSLSLEKKEINDSLYELRKTLEKVGLYSKNDNTETNPENLIPFLLIKLHSELSEIPIPKYIDNDIIYKILAKNHYFVENEKLIFKVYLNIFKEKFWSFISSNFLTFIKNDYYCNNCQETIFNFSAIYYLHIKPRKYINKDKIDISNYLYSKKRQCPKCNTESIHNRKISIYKPAKNLIIILDRGKNYQDKTYVNFDENLSLKNHYYEVDSNYKLKGIISKNKEYYNCFIERNYNWVQIDSNKKEKDKFVITPMKLCDIKNKDLIICLFYELTNEKLTSEAQDLQKAYKSLAKKNKTNLTQVPLNLNKDNSSQALNNDPQNSNNSININFQAQSQNNLNLHSQSSFNPQMNYNNMNFNNTCMINNNNYKYNNQPAMKNYSEVNPNNQIYKGQNQSNNNTLYDLNINKTLVNFSPNNFISKPSFDSSEYLREVEYKTVYQKSAIPIYINQEYDILEEEKINYINEDQEKKIGFL